MSERVAREDAVGEGVASGSLASEDATRGGVMNGITAWRMARCAAALGFAVLAGCSSPSEVMVAVQTDFELPSEIDTIEIRVWRGNDPKFVHAYELPGAENAGVRLPLTIGLVAEEEPGADTRVQVIGWEGATPRIVREAVTTIPRERVALLHLPLQFLCDHTAQPPASGVDLTGRVGSTCGPDKTCVAGACVASRVDSASLPDYAPEAVFGGSAIHGGSACFDVARCFEDAEAIEISALGEDCTFRAPGPVNVALETSAEDVCGVRDGGRCLVALDGGTEAGFIENEGLVTLPPAACDRKHPQGSKVSRVLRAPARDGCPQKTQALPLCGAWSVAPDGR